MTSPPDDVYLIPGDELDVVHDANEQAPTKPEGTAILFSRDDGIKVYAPLGTRWRWHVAGFDYFGAIEADAARWRRLPRLVRRLFA